MIDVPTATQDRTASAPSRPPRRHPEAVGFQDFLGLEFPPLRERVAGLLPAQGFGLLLAAEKAGKSLLSLQLGLSVASGTPFLGGETEPCPVLLIEEEGSALEMQDRMVSQASALGLLDQGLDLHTAVCPRYRLDAPDSLADLESEIERTRAGLVVMGPLSQLATIGDENKAPEMNSVVRTIVEVAGRHGALIVLAHHRRKDDPKSGPPKSAQAFFASSRGSNALTSGMDAGIGFVRDPADSKGTFFTMRRNGPAQSFGISLDLDTLIFSADGRSMGRVQHPTLEEVEQVVLDAGGWVPRSQVAKAVGCSETTARKRLDSLVGLMRLTSKKGPRATTMYRLSCDDPSRSRSF